MAVMSDDELNEILAGVLVDGWANSADGPRPCMQPVADTNVPAQLLEWRDAAVARFLAEAGAVHPKVHTPNRVQQWLGEHGWQAQAPTSHGLTAQWMREGKRVFVPLRTDTADYVRFAGYTISIGAEVAGVRFQQALLEISALSDEVTL